MKHPTIVIKSENEKVVTIDRHRLINVYRGNSIIFVNPSIGTRLYGELKNKAFVLSSTFDWVLATDSEGCLCLIPLRKTQ